MESDTTNWDAFAERHHFNLHGDAEPFDCWEWLEMKSQKP